MWVCAVESVHPVAFTSAANVNVLFDPYEIRKSYADSCRSCFFICVFLPVREKLTKRVEAVRELTQFVALDVLRDPAVAQVGDRLLEMATFRVDTLEPVDFVEHSGDLDPAGRDQELPASIRRLNLLESAFHSVAARFRPFIAFDPSYPFEHRLSPRRLQREWGGTRSRHDFDGDCAFGAFGARVFEQRSQARRDVYEMFDVGEC